MLRKLLKDRPRIKDALRVLGGQRAAPAFRGMRMPDGRPVSVELIMKTHGVTRERAEDIARRQTR